MPDMETAALRRLLQGEGGTLQSVV
jgi:hypothetical protein